MKKNFLNEDGEGSNFQKELAQTLPPKNPPFSVIFRSPPTNEIHRMRTGQDFLETARKIEETRKENELRIAEAKLEEQKRKDEYNEARKKSEKPASKNITPYVYAGIGLIVILIIARMVTKK